MTLILLPSQRMESRCSNKMLFMNIHGSPIHSRQKLETTLSLLMNGLRKDSMPLNWSIIQLSKGMTHAAAWILKHAKWKNPDTMGLQRRFSGYECLMLLQRTWAMNSEFILGNSQPCITPDPKSDGFIWSLRMLHTCACTHTHTYTHTHKHIHTDKKIKI